ncbi:MAG: sensor histidine kinase, partial [Bradymonadaceae bacterium]
RDCTIMDVLPGPEFDLDAHLEALQATGETREEALLNNLADDEFIPVDVRAARIALADEEVVVELVRDISDRKRAQEALVGKKRAEELAELRSMFLSTLSHDVRSPLSAIITVTQLLRRHVGDDHGQLVDRIERSTTQLRKFLDSILRMARLDIGEALAASEEIELVGQIEEIMDVHQALADQKGLALDYEGPEPSVEARLDPRFLAQILNNLLDNAVKYTDEGEVAVRLHPSEDDICIEVADTGPGISDEYLEQIFERGETGSLESEESHSEGLGLAITKQLTEAMGGSVSVDSTLGEGTVFRVDLPRWR